MSVPGFMAQIELRTHSILRIETQIHGQCFAQATQRDKSSRDGDAAERDLCHQQDIAKRPGEIGDVRAVYRVIDVRTAPLL